MFKDKFIRALIIFVIGIVTTFSVAYTGFRAIAKHTAQRTSALEAEISEKRTNTIESTVSEFGLKQLNRDRTETNVVYFKLKNDENYFCSSPSLKSHFLMQPWFKNLMKGDTVRIVFLKSQEYEKVIPIVEMFYKHNQVLFQESFINDEVLNEKHWLEETTYRFPNLVMIIILTSAFFMLWGFSILGLIKKPK